MFCILVAMLFLLPANAIFVKEKEIASINTKQAIQPPTPIFYVPFDGNVNATIAGGDPIPHDHINWQDYEFTDGIRGQALSKPADIANYVLSYRELNNLIPEQGTIEFWIRLKERIDDGTYFYEEDGNKIHIRQHRYVDGYPGQISFRFKGATRDFTLTRGWVGEWHQIAFTWQILPPETDGPYCILKAYIDGYYKPLGSKFFCSPAQQGEKFYVGRRGWDKSYADIDELKIYDVPLTEEEIQRNYMALFPVEYYAKETIFKIYGKEQIPIELYVNITNIRKGFIPSKIDGTFKCQVDDLTPSSMVVDLDEGETATLMVKFTAQEVGEYDLNCYFIPDGAPEERYNRTIKLFIIDGNPRPHPDTLNKSLILSIDCATNTYSGPQSGTVEYCETTDETTTPNNQYRQSGLSGATEASTPYRGPTGHENVTNWGFKSPENAYYDDDYYAVAEDRHAEIYRNFSIPTDLIPDGAVISGIRIRLDANCTTNDGYLKVSLSWNGGADWTEERMARVDTSWATHYLGGRWVNWGHDWDRQQLSNESFKVKINASVWPGKIYLDWVAVKVYWKGLFSRFAYKFEIQNESNPHLVVVTYPDDETRIMGIDLSSKSPHSEPGRRSPQAFYQIQTGVFTGDEYPNTNEFKQHTIYFWPRDDEYMITFVNWLAGPVGAGAAVRNISVYEIEGDEQTGWFPKTEVITPPDGSRMLGLWWEQTEFPDSFCAFNESLQEYYKATLNAMDYLHFTGQNLLIYNIWQYAPPHYPSRAERNIYNLWFPVRSHPWPADWFELLLKVAEVNDVNVIPSFTITSIPSLDVLEEADTGYTVDLIKEKMLNITDDILEQYGDYPAFKGISLNIWSDTMNKRLMEQGVYINNLLGDINTRIQQQGRPDLKLIVSCWHSPDIDDWYSSPNRPQFVYDSYEEIGLDLTQLKAQNDGIRTERVVRFTGYRERLTGDEPPTNAWPSRKFVLDYDSCYKPFIKSPPNQAAAIYNGYFERKVKTNSMPLPCSWASNLERNWHAGAIAPGHKYFMENYMLVMIHLDPIQIGNGGLTIGTVGHEEQIQKFAKAYRALPAKSFEIVEDTDDFQVREKTIGWHYFYIVNKKPDLLSVTVTFSFPFVLLFDLVDGTFIPIIFSNQYTTTLEPFELRSYLIIPRWVQITDVTSP